MLHLLRKTTVDATKCYTSHVKQKWMSPSATPATQTAAASRATIPGPRAPPNAISPTPATQNDRGYEFVPQLPHETKMDITTQTAAASRATKPGPSAPPSTISSTPATQNDRGCEFAPRRPRETKVDVTKCHACHANNRGVTGDKIGPKGAIPCHKCHACHAKRRWM